MDPFTGPGGFALQTPQPTICRPPDGCCFSAGVVANRPSTMGLFSLGTSPGEPMLRPIGPDPSQSRPISLFSEARRPDARTSGSPQRARRTYCRCPTAQQPTSSAPSAAHRRQPPQSRVRRRSGPCGHYSLATSAKKSRATSAKSTRSELLAKTTAVKPPWLSWRFRNQSQTRF